MSLTFDTTSNKDERNPNFTESFSPRTFVTTKDPGNVINLTCRARGRTGVVTLSHAPRLFKAIRSFLMAFSPGHLVSPFLRVGYPQVLLLVHTAKSATPGVRP